jgi:hypothetical protein
LQTRKHKNPNNENPDDPILPKPVSLPILHNSRPNIPLASSSQQPIPELPLGLHVCGRQRGLLGTERPGDRLAAADRRGAALCAQEDVA